MHSLPAQTVKTLESYPAWNSFICLDQLYPLTYLPLHPLWMQCLLRAPLLVLVVTPETAEPETETLSLTSSYKKDLPGAVRIASEELCDLGCRSGSFTIVAATITCFSAGNLFNLCSSRAISASICSLSSLLYSNDYDDSLSIAAVFFTFAELFII